MTGYAVVTHRGYDRLPSGQQRRREWWWFFTQPFVYSVWWRPDGSKTLDQFLNEQAAKVKAHLLSADEGVSPK